MFRAHVNLIIGSRFGLPELGETALELELAELG